MCLICPEIYLCQACYEKRLAQNNGEKSTHWKRVCGVNHKYLKGSIQGWKGVKNGVMTVGDEKIGFTQWLEDVERKWGEWMNEKEED
jgi:hypothetical protein